MSESTQQTDGALVRRASAPFMPAVIWWDPLASRGVPCHGRSAEILATSVEKLFVHT